MLSRLSPWQKNVLLGLAWLVLTIYFYFPVSGVMDVTLDSSNYASYSYFTAHHFQFGPQVVPMTGPYGFVLYGFVYNADLFWLRTLCEIVLKGAFAALVLWFMWDRRHLPSRWAWLAVLIVFSSVLEDFPAEWMMLLGALFLLRPADRRPATRWVLLIGALLAFLSLMKGTHFVLASATMILLLGYYAWIRAWKDVRNLAVAFAGAFLLLWVLAAQNPLNIPSFIHGIRQLTNGYNEAMALQEEMTVTARGLVVLGALGLGIGWAAWRKRNDRNLLVAFALFAGFTFVNWKHGFVRADGHVYIFFHFGIVAALTIYLLAASEARTGWRQLLSPGTILTIIAVGGSLYGAGEKNLPRITWLLRQVPLQFEQRVRQLSSLRSARAGFDRDLARQKSTFAMTLTKLTAQDDPIDLLGVKHGIIPLNGLNYSPRPMGGGSFNAYNRFLTEANRDFIRDPERAPKFYLVKFDTIDNRLVAEDDPLSLIALLQHYTPVLMEQGYLLMRRVPGPTRDEPLLIKRATLRFGELMDVPPVPPGRILLTRFELPPNLVGRLRGAVYKPPLIFMSLIGEGIEFPHSRRIVPSMVASPFVLAPVVEEEIDLLNLYTPRAGKRVDRFGLFTDHPGLFATEKLAVEFYTLPRPSVPTDLDVEELVAAARSPISNIPPESIKPADAPALTLHGLPILKLEPPGEMVWRLEGNERELLFDFGLDPEAYEKGKGNGVVFIAELRPIDGGHPTELYRHHLDPFSRVEDRGNHSTRVVLPPVRAGMRLALRTDAGPYGDAAWDWSYLTRVQIKRGDFSLKQFPGFNVAPVAADADHAAAAGLDKEQVFVLHAPGMLTFKLNGQEKALRFDFGYMPGAYSAGGNTDGGAFVVELARPNQPKEVLFRKELRPVQQPEDQGRHRAEINLPPLGPADRLIVRTESGPRDERSWDWTYLANFVLQ